MFGRARAPRRAVILSLVVALGACQQFPNPLAGLAAGASGDGATRPEQRPSRAAVRLERDVEAPEIFRAEEEALWDGRPSLGGIWVAAPDVTSPERVAMRNGATGKEVIGALFRRERISPGPRLQLSSEAAAALGILAGAPTSIEVVALRDAEPAPTVETAAAPAPADAQTP